MKERLVRDMYRKRPTRGEEGMTLVELMIALTILVIGMGAVMIMISSAIAQNNGTKRDSQGTMLAQMIAEQIITVPGNVGNPANPNPAPVTVSPVLTDCRNPVPQNHLIAVTAAPAGAGALRVPQPAPAGRVAGDIDFTQAFGAIPFEAGTGARYAIQYVACGNANRQETYDVRWNIQSIGPNTKLITVAARRRNNVRGAGFNVPITIRTIAGL
jgi:prepilin-type N-terminal cleavage/methylation domain-containing protein